MTPTGVPYTDYSSTDTHGDPLGLLSVTLDFYAPNGYTRPFVLRHTFARQPHVLGHSGKVHWTPLFDGDRSLLLPLWCDCGCSVSVGLIVGLMRELFSHTVRVRRNRVSLRILVGLRCDGEFPK